MPFLILLAMPYLRW